MKRTIRKEDIKNNLTADSDHVQELTQSSYGSYKLAKVSHQ